MKRIEKYLLLLIVIAISLFTLLVITNKTRYLDYKIFVVIHNIIKYNDINMVKLISDLSVKLFNGTIFFKKDVLKKYY